MFEDSLIESGNRFKTKRLSTTIFSFVLQVVLICVLILIPLIYTDALPKTQLMTFLVAPPPPPPPPPPPAAAAIKVVKMQSEMVNGELRQPTKIPRKVQMIREDEAPPDLGAGGVPGGVPGGIPGGSAGGVIGGILRRRPWSRKLRLRARPRIAGVSTGLLIKKVTPNYPQLAKQARIQGSVVLQAEIGSNDHDDAPMSGFELTYNRELIHKASWRGGLEGAFAYTYIHVHDAGPLSASVTRVDDTYAFPQGVDVVPSAPYAGAIPHPPGRLGTLLNASPSRSTTAVQQDAASITGQRDFSADLFGFRLGPYVEIPLSKRIAFSLSGGFALMYVSSEFSFNQTVTIPGVGSVAQQASGNGSGWLPGGYVAGNFSVALSEAWSVVAGAQFEDVGRVHPDLGWQASDAGFEQVNLRNHWSFLLFLTKPLRRAVGEFDTQESGS